MPPKGSNRRRAPGGGAAASAAASIPGEASVPQTPTLAESLSYLHYPRPFKNSSYTKNASRRTKNLKTVLTQERERERAERERRRAEREEAAAEAAAAEEGEDKMDTDVGAGEVQKATPLEDEDMPTYASIEAPPSILPQKRYCDITGLEAPYTDPATGLRYHDKSIYEFIKTLNASAVKEYLALRGVNPIVK